jgi:hypothetical protein
MKQFQTLFNNKPYVEIKKKLDWKHSSGVRGLALQAGVQSPVINNLLKIKMKVRKDSKSTKHLLFIKCLVIISKYYTLLKVL